MHPVVSGVKCPMLSTVKRLLAFLLFKILVVKVRRLHKVYDIRKEGVMKIVLLNYSSHPFGKEYYKQSSIFMFSDKHIIWS